MQEGLGEALSLSLASVVVLIVAEDWRHVVEHHEEVEDI
jgi:hypothetical protein